MNKSFTLALSFMLLFGFSAMAVTHAVAVEPEATDPVADAAHEAVEKMHKASEAAKNTPKKPAKAHKAAQAKPKAVKAKPKAVQAKNGAQLAKPAPVLTVAAVSPDPAPVAPVQVAAAQAPVQLAQAQAPAPVIQAPVLAAAASGFEGLYIGAKAGYDASNASGAHSASVGSAFVSGEAGYNWAVRENLLLGAVFWADNHRSTVTARDYGVDFKLGKVKDNVLYYAKLGVALTNPGTRLHYGVGGEYKFAPRWGAMAEVTYDSKSKDAVTYSNTDFMVGVAYHF